MLGTNAPMWIGEFAAFMPDKSGRLQWAQDALQLFNGHGIGWAWWAFNPAYSDGEIPQVLSATPASQPPVTSTVVHATTIPPSPVTQDTITVQRDTTPVRQEPNRGTVVSSVLFTLLATASLVAFIAMVVRARRNVPACRSASVYNP